MSIAIAEEHQHREDDFPLDAVEALWRMEERHFWHAARNRWILGALERHGVLPGASVLEVGCGSGAVAMSLFASGYQVTGVDTARPLIKKADERCPNGRFFVGPVEALPAALQGPYDAVGLFDVLEHLDDPMGLLRASIRFGRPGAKVIVTVPGLRSLHTIIDDLSGHKKRYEPGELKALLEGAGVRDVVEYGIFRLTQPIIQASRLRQKKVPLSSVDAEMKKRILADEGRIPPMPVNVALGWLCAAERALGARFSRGKPGPSLLAIGTR